jgi:hypothetical protein
MLKVSLSTMDSKPGGITRQYVDFEFYNYSLLTMLIEAVPKPTGFGTSSIYHNFQSSVK